jgi:hypothetical protein
MRDNPFDRYDIDPFAGPEAITERFRELIEDADEAAKDELRAVWEKLITHVRTRLRHALLAFPSAQSPAASVAGSVATRPSPADEPPLSLADVVLLPSIVSLLEQDADEQIPAVLSPIGDDPNLIEE